jgi:glutamine---fructose-6-phosphate transaminase (isomerizing)
MCGLVGYVGKRDALEVLMNGLEKLEYRGYDSAGVALVEQGVTYVTKASGKLKQLAIALEERARKSQASVGIGHTRWATHGAPTTVNAHPHQVGQVTLIHNGIVENYHSLKQQFVANDTKVLSETDTEIAAYVIDSVIGSLSSDSTSPSEYLSHFASACELLKGSYSILALLKPCPDTIFLAKTATPLIIGLGEEEFFIASDIPAILPYTKKIIVLEDGDVAAVSSSGFVIHNSGNNVQRPVQTLTWDLITAQKGGYKHFMLKEIYEQVVSTSETVRGRGDTLHNLMHLPELEPISSLLGEVERVVFVGCGTAWHACQIGKFYLENIAGVSCDVDYASEFRYRRLNFGPKTLVIAVSQSGETADTIAAIESLAPNIPTLGICNVQGATLTRKCSATFYTQAGPEISVASTKAFTAQLTTLYLTAVRIGVAKGQISTEDANNLIQDIVRLPTAIDEALKVSKAIEKTALKIASCKSVLFLGRGLCYPIALEGALKLKEISYIHAEGYPAGEIKHGPLALIDKNVPVVFLLQKEDRYFDKTFSNLREVHSREAPIIAITDNLNCQDLTNYVSDLITLPFLSNLISPIIMTIPLQFLAYYIAAHNGTDVDLPRNLAKSVTVE